MKNNILKYFGILFLIIGILIVYLSTIGIETDRLNSQIKNKIIQTNEKIDLDLKKIKIVLDPLNFQIYARTEGATIFYLKRPLEIEYIKIQVSLSSLIKNKITSSNIEVTTKSILLNDLIKFVKVASDKPELFIIEKGIKKGHVTLELNLNVDNDGKIKNDYQIKGLIKEAKVGLLNNIKFKNINLGFNFKKDSYSLSEIKFTANDIDFFSKKININKKKNIFFINGSLKNNESELNNNIFKLLDLNIKNLNIDEVKFITTTKFSFEINNRFKVKNIILNSDVIFNKLKYKKPNIIQNYFSDINDFILLNNHKFNLRYKNKNLSIKGKGEIQIEKQADQIKYSINKNGKDLKINSDLFLKKINLKKQDIYETYFPKLSEKIIFKNQKLKINYNNKILTFFGAGTFKSENDFEEINYFFEKSDKKIKFSSNLSLKNTNFKIDNINYEKKDKNRMNLEIKGELNDNKKFNIKNLIINEGNNQIKIVNLFLKNINQIVKIEEANFNYLDTENKRNNFTIKHVKDFDYNFEGISFNANSLITNLLKNKEKQENNLSENSFNINLDLKEVFVDNIHYVKDLKGKLTIKKNKVIDADILAFFDDSQNIVFSIKINDQNEKITTIFSSRAKPLVSRYKFIKGFKDDKEGYLDFSSSKKNGVSTSRLVIDNFKVKEIPALAKLLALASLQGIADLLTGEGIRFTDFEMNFTSENKLMRIQELYAIGPAISILLEGYVEEDNLISLRGTLVPATTINRSISSIPIVGEFLIGNKVGEGVFGVSFKVKGPPKNLETTVNPIKTLTPRFITRTLEKIKKN